jgi:excisionase family DNA binding protein
MDLSGLEGRLFLTVTEFAEISRADPRTVRRGIASGDIPAVRFSDTTRIPVSHVLELLGLKELGEVQGGTR